MYNLLRCRRGSAAFVTVIALVPLIGVVALGAEGGSWYVTKQHAQNAADAAAYSGALKLACDNAAPCADAQSVDYRGRQFAAQNAFCNAGDTSYPGSQCVTPLPKGITSRAVQIDVLTSWNGVPGNFVRAIVSQQQPAQLARVLGLTDVNIPATAIAQVQVLQKPPCVLALNGSISFQGSPNINAPNCGMASNSNAKDAIDFTGGGMSMNVGSLSAAGGCTGKAEFCKDALTYMPPVTNPFSVLDGVTTPTLSTCNSKNLTAYSAATPCKNDGKDVKLNNQDVNVLSGVYFISGTVKLTGQATICTATPNHPDPRCRGATTFALLILLPGGSLDTKGGGFIDIAGIPSVAASQLPPAFQSYASLFANMAIYKMPDPDQSKNGPNDITIGGNSGLSFKGTIYLPSANVTFQGNPTIDLGGGVGCGELIAKSVAFNGNATLNNSGCPAATKPISQYVRLVQ